MLPTNVFHPQSNRQAAQLLAMDVFGNKSGPSAGSAIRQSGDDPTGGLVFVSDTDRYMRATNGKVSGGRREC
jgi:hypothetical protein